MLAKFHCIQCNQSVTASGRKINIICSCRHAMIKEEKENPLLSLRKEQGKSQGQISDIVGISKSYLSKLEHGKANITDKLREKFSVLYNVDLS